MGLSFHLLQTVNTITGLMPPGDRQKVPDYLEPWVPAWKVFLEDQNSSFLIRNDQYDSLVCYIYNMNRIKRVEKRVILIHWKSKPDRPVEVFSNLKLLCQSYPEYNYNTLNNYLSKAKTAYETETIKVERLPIFSRPLLSATVTRSITPVVSRQPLKALDEKEQDLVYWLSRPVKERLAAVTFIISQSLKKGERMDRSIVHFKKVKS